jgi:hypothetical protein
MSEHASVTAHRSECLIRDHAGELRVPPHDGIDHVEVTTPRQREDVLATLEPGEVFKSTKLRPEEGGKVNASAVGVRIWVDGGAALPSDSDVDAAVEWLEQLALHRFDGDRSDDLRGPLHEAIGTVRAACADERFEVVRLGAVAQGIVVGVPYPDARWGTRLDLVVGIGQDRYWLSTQARTTLGRPLGLERRPGIAPASAAILSLRPIADRLAEESERLRDVIVSAEADVDTALEAGGKIDVKRHLRAIRAAMVDCAQQTQRAEALRRSAERLSHADAVVEPREGDALARILSSAERLDGARARLSDLQQALLTAATFDQGERTRALQTTVTIATGVLVVPALIAGIFGANVEPFSSGSGVDLGVFLSIVIAFALAGLAGVVLMVEPDDRAWWHWVPLAILLAVGVGEVLALFGVALPDDSWAGVTVARAFWVALAAAMACAAWIKRLAR